MPFEIIFLALLILLAACSKSGPDIRPPRGKWFALLLTAVCSTASAEPTILYRPRWQHRMSNGHWMTIVEAEIEIPRGASVMGWGTSQDVARQNVIEAYRRRLEDVKRVSSVIWD